MQITALLAGNVWRTIGGVAIAIVILLVMVTIHEFGHYVAGKALGFKINEFSVGFGPAIFKKRSKKTGEIFALRVIPLGGYCAFDGEDYEEEEKEKEKQVNEPLFEEFPQTEQEVEGGEKLDEKAPIEERIEITPSENAEEHREDSVLEKEKTEEKEKEEYPEPKGAKFNDQPPWKRIIVLVAGATMNYLLALVLIVLMFSIYGQPLYAVEAPREGMYLAPMYETGDIIESIEGEDVYYISDYIDILKGKSKGEVVEVGVIRNGERTTLKVTLEQDAEFANISDTSTALKVLGLDGLRVTTHKYGFFQTIGKSFVYSWKTAGIVLRSLGELITGKIGITSMGGPGTTIAATAQAASMGMLSILNIAAFIGVNLAVFNLLPIPALDGCKVIFCIIEWIRKKPVNRKVETMIHFIGIIFLFAFAILLDVLQWVL